jgi:hypothetical protein
VAVQSGALNSIVRIDESVMKFNHTKNKSPAYERHVRAKMTTETILPLAHASSGPFGVLTRCESSPRLHWRFLICS